MNKLITTKEVYIFLISVYLLALPLNALNIGSFGSILKLLAILPILIAFISGNKIKLNAPERWQLYFTLFATFSIVWSTSIDSSITRCGSYITLLALLISASFFKYDENDISKIKNALIWSSRITAIVLLVFGEFDDGRLWLKGIITEDPNYICAYLAFGVVFALSRIFTKKKLFSKLLGGAETVGYIIIVFLTGSRGGLLAILIAVGVYILFFSQKKGSILVKTLCIIFAIILINVVLENLPIELKNRFSFENVAESGGSGRTELWANAIDMFYNANSFRKIFGFGISTVRYNMELQGYSKVNVVHNMFLEMLIELGIIGLIIYTVAIFLFAKKAFGFQDKFAFAVITCMIVLSMSTSIYTFKPYFNIMLYIVVLQNGKVCCANKIIDKNAQYHRKEDCGFEI